MASLYIKDEQAANGVARLAKRLGTTKTDVVRRGVAAIERELGPSGKPADYVARMNAYRAAHPLPPLIRRMPDKTFYDWLSGEEA